MVTLCRARSAKTNVPGEVSGGKTFLRGGVRLRDVMGGPCVFREVVQGAVPAHVVCEDAVKTAFVDQ